jgi:lysophospholipid acyltransferase (LPLAT)-like uncharacterized protein
VDRSAVGLLPSHSMTWFLTHLRLLLTVLGSLAIVLLARLLQLTWRVRCEGLRPGGAALYAFWHGDQLALSALKLRKLTVLISRSRDGQLATRVARLLGYDVVRGSTSAGAVAGALGLIRRLLAGRSVGLAVDGPRGPRHEVGPAPQRLATRGQASLVPLAAVARRGLRLRSWDRFLVPAPFTTIHVVFGEPVASDAVLQRELDRVKARAEALALRRGRQALAEG